MDQPNTYDAGLLKVVPNSALNAEDIAADKALEDAEEGNNSPVIQGLSGHVMKCWESARKARSFVNDRLLTAQQTRLGKYTPTKLAAIRAVGGSEEYARVTANKCRVADAWLRDVYLGQTEKPWTLDISPVPDLPKDEMDKIRQAVAAEVAQAAAFTGQPPEASIIEDRISELEEAVSQRVEAAARETVARMEKRMEDQLLEGNFEVEWGKFITDLVTYPAAHFKGPILRSKNTVAWGPDANGGWAPHVKETVAVEFERVDPFRCYPAPNASCPQDGYFIEHVTYTTDDMHSLIGLPGFNEPAIRGVLADYGTGGLTNWLGLVQHQQSDVDGSAQTTNDSPLVDIDGLEYSGLVRGKDLLEWGMDPSKIDDPDADYDACVWLIGKWVIKAQLNYDPMRTRPIFKSSWEEVPGDYWGLGLVDALGDVQGIVNAAVRALVNNMGMASGPQVEVNVDRLPAGESITTIVPWKVYQTQDSEFGTGSGGAVNFFQPDSNVSELLTVIEKFYEFADNWSLIPRYMSGDSSSGGAAGRTASGLSMLLNAANKGLKGVVSNMDATTLSPMLNKLYTLNMLFDEDDSIKGDATAAAKGAVSLMQLETLQLRRNEFLAATNNETDMSIIGPDGRKAVLREVAKGLEMDINEVIPPTPQGPAAAPPGQQPQAEAAPGGEQLVNGAAVTDNMSPSGLL